MFCLAGAKSVEGFEGFEGFEEFEVVWFVEAELEVIVILTGSPRCSVLLSSGIKENVPSVTSVGTSR